MEKKQVYSTSIALASLALALAPIPGLAERITVVSGTELAKPLEELVVLFEKKYPAIDLELKFQGSQDIVNNLVDRKNDFQPTVLIPAAQEDLNELQERLTAQNQKNPFRNSPQPIAKTLLVGIAWPERGKVLFPDGKFRWQRLEEAMLAGNWEKIGGPTSWGSFDFVMSDPTRSNSGQITLDLWVQSQGKDLRDPAIASLLATVKKSVYLPPRSTDILLQEFIARGPNDADVATVYESIALSRWSEAGVSKGQPYQIYYLNPTVETVASAVIVQENVSSQQAKAAAKFLAFLTEVEGQKIFVKYGFRPVSSEIDLESVPHSPWQANIPGAELNPSATKVAPPQVARSAEIQRLWHRQ